MKHIAVIMLILSVLISFHSEAQTPYYYNSDGTHNSVNDKNWDVVTLKLDEEFSNETSTKTNWNYYWLGHSRIEKSDLFYLEGDVCYDNYQNCLPYDFTSNHNHAYNTSGTGTMTLSCRFESPSINTYYTWYTNTSSGRTAKTYTISTGQVISKMAYKYGYFEARFRVNRAPGSQCQGMGQCFWLFADYNNDHPISGVPSRQTDYSEIDIAENDAMRGLMTSNHWYRINPNKDPKYFDHFERHIDDCDRSFVSHNDARIQQDQWHTYALEWTPTEMNTYYDNILVRHMEYPADQFDAMNVILDIEGAKTEDGDKYRFCRPIHTGTTTLPFNFELDFVKIYRLKMDGCSTSFNQTNYSFDASNYTYDVKKNITLGQNNLTTASVKIDWGEKVSIRAVEYISLEDGFEVDDNIGTEFFATTNGSCDN